MLLPEEEAGARKKVTESGGSDFVDSEASHWLNKRTSRFNRLASRRQRSPKRPKHAGTAPSSVNLGCVVCFATTRNAPKSAGINAQ